MDAQKKEQQPGSSCPVDDNARAAWLRTQASTQSSGENEGGASCNSSAIDQSARAPRWPRDPSSSGTVSNTDKLATERVISSIPRANDSAALANNERETSASRTGNWIYPSEQMFFDAMRRKNFGPNSEDMKTIVPIHNAVNERAWSEIKRWEKDQGGERYALALAIHFTHDPHTKDDTRRREKQRLIQVPPGSVHVPSCGGPKLHSFSGDSQAMTPRARLNTLVGYTAPFDRHDWVVDRCGKKVDYVIDFYSGKDETGGRRGLSFYLDVRPKLNSWEGLRMRVARAWGFA